MRGSVSQLADHSNSFTHRLLTLDRSPLTFNDSSSLVLRLRPNIRLYRILQTVTRENSRDWSFR
jgi:hypothetical protein